MQRSLRSTSATPAARSARSAAVQRSSFPPLSRSASKRLEIPALVEVNLSGEGSKSGIAPEELPAFLDLYPRVLGLMTMPPESGDPEASRPYFRRLRELAAEHGLKELSMGTSQDWRVAVEEGATLVRLGTTLYGD